MSFTLAFALRNPGLSLEAQHPSAWDFLDGPQRSRFVHLVSRVAQGAYVDSPSGWRPAVMHHSRLRNPRAAEWLPLLDDAA